MKINIKSFDDLLGFMALNIVSGFVAYQLLFSVGIASPQVFVVAGSVAFSFAGVAAFLMAHIVLGGYRLWGERVNHLNHIQCKSQLNAQGNPASRRILRAEECSINQRLPNRIRSVWFASSTPEPIREEWNTWVYLPGLGDSLYNRNGEVDDPLDNSYEDDMDQYLITSL